MMSRNKVLIAILVILGVIGVADPIDAREAFKIVSSFSLN